MQHQKKEKKKRAKDRSVCRGPARSTCMLGTWWSSIGRVAVKSCSSSWRLVRPPFHMHVRYWPFWSVSFTILFLDRIKYLWSSYSILKGDRIECLWPSYSISKGITCEKGGSLDIILYPRHSPRSRKNLGLRSWRIPIDGTNLSRSRLAHGHEGWFSLSYACKILSTLTFRPHDFVRGIGSNGTFMILELHSKRRLTWKRRLPQHIEARVFLDS